jgi:hypothetical protein
MTDTYFVDPALPTVFQSRHPSRHSTTYRQDRLSIALATKSKAHQFAFGIEAADSSKITNRVSMSVEWNREHADGAKANTADKRSELYQPVPRVMACFGPE